MFLVLLCITFSTFEQLSFVADVILAKIILIRDEYIVTNSFCLIFHVYVYTFV